MNKTEFNFNKAVYEYDGNIYVCDYIFLDYWPAHLSFKQSKQGTSFMGATGSVVNRLTEEERQARIENYDVEELWQMAVKDGQYTGSLDDYKDMLNDSGDLENIAIEEYTTDIVNYEALNIPELTILETSGGGRCFDFDEMLKLYSEKPKGFIIYDESLFLAILAVEHTHAEVIKEIIASARIGMAYKYDDKDKKTQAEIIRHATGLLKAYTKK